MINWRQGAVMMRNIWLEKLFATIDQKDAVGFIGFLSPKARFRFANAPAVSGVENIEPFVTGFFNSIDGLSHQLLDIFAVEDGAVCHGVVTYTRLDLTKLAVPFACVLKGSEQGIDEYLIFSDNSALYSTIVNG
jgi:hypothetical protein